MSRLHPTMPDGRCRPPLRPASSDSAARIADPRRVCLRLAPLLVGFALLGIALPSVATPPPRSGGAAAFGDREADARPSLVGRTGVRHASELLSMGSIADRLRGLERLGSIGGREALEALKDALAGGPILNDPRTRLAAVQALAPHALHEEARLGLVAVVQHPLEDDLPRGRGALARDEAVFALARAAAGLVPAPPPSSLDASGISFEERAYTPLLAAVIGNTSVGEVAERAMLLHPPADLGAFVRGVATATVPEITLLGRLGDPRAIPMLRRSLLRKEPSVQTSAMLALARLGDHTALSLARDGIAPVSPGARVLPARSVERRIAAVEALLLLGAGDAPAELARLLVDDGTRDAALDLAERWPSSHVVAALESSLAATAAKESLRPALVAVLRRIGDEASALVLAKFLDSTDVGASAAVALAESPSANAGGLLLKAMSGAPAALRGVLLRAWLVRAQQRGELPVEVARAFDGAASSSVPNERAFGIFANAVLGRTALPSAVARAAAASDTVALAALVSACASRGPEELRVLLPLAQRALLAGPHRPLRERSPNDLVTAEVQRIEQVALGLLLLVSSDLGSAGQLAEWAESGGPASLQAAFRLGSRDSRLTRERTDALLDGTSPILRAHVALGLGESPEPHAAARLEQAYRFEVDASVRLAIVRALSLRSEPPRQRVLGLASTLDPDDEVRGTAAAALRGARFVSIAARASRLSWLSLDTAAPDSDGTLRARVVEHVGRSGLAVPTLSSPDGVALAFTHEEVVRRQVRPTW